MSYDCYCDYEMPTWSRTAWVKSARKEHKCYECFRCIEVGENYHSAHGMWGGRVRTFHVCADCWAIKEWVEAHVPCLCWAYGNILDDCWSEVSNWPVEEAPGLKFGTLRRYVIGRRKRKLQEAA